MRDLRELASIAESWQYEGRFWRDTPFRWKRWLFHDPEWTQDHSRFCWACICNHRDRFPETDPGERGCFRHAWLARRESPKEGRRRHHLPLGLPQLFQAGTEGVRVDG